MADFIHLKDEAKKGRKGDITIIRGESISLAPAEQEKYYKKKLKIKNKRGKKCIFPPDQ